MTLPGAMFAGIISKLVAELEELRAGMCHVRAQRKGGKGTRSGDDDLYALRKVSRGLNSLSGRHSSCSC